MSVARTGDEPTGPSSSAGRPRDPTIDDAILRATRDLLIESGYSGVAFDSVARRAGVTRPTVYRRWPSKMHLVHEAVFPAQRQVPVPRTDDFEADLRAVIRRMFESYSRPEARAALPGLIADLHGDVALRSSVIDRLEAQARADFAEMIERAQHDGAFTSEIDANLVLDTIAGAMFHRVVARAVTEEAFVDELAQLLLNGMRPVKARAAAKRRNGENPK